MIVQFYVDLYRSIPDRSRALARWIQFHPRSSLALGVLLMVIALFIKDTATAYAAGGGSTSLPWLPPFDATDGHGVPLANYAVLPLDRGDLLSWDKKVIAQGIDFVWVVNIAALAWVLWLFEWLLSFAWVDWISAPLKDVATLIQGMLSQIHWIPLALSVAGGVAGIAILMGKYAAGGVEIAVSVMCSILAVGILANPVTALTGENGALNWAQSWGANIAASVVTDSTEPQLPTGNPSSDDASALISTAITSELMDAFVRHPAQAIAFGHELSGSCDKIFTAEVKKASPIDTTATAVRDAVGACDPAAQEYVTHTNVGQTAAATSSLVGTSTLMLLGVVLALLLIMCVFYTLFQAMKLMGAVYAAIAPGVAREAMWKSLIGMYGGAISVGFTVVILAVYLKLLTEVMSQLRAANFPVIAQNNVITLIVIALIVTLVITRYRTKKAGHALAERLAKLGFGMSSQKQGMHPIVKSGLRTAERFAADKLINGWDKKSVTPQPTPAKKIAPAVAATAVQTAITGTRIAGELTAAAATGGTSAVVIQAAKIGGKTILQRQLASRIPAAGEPSTPATWKSDGRQIVVDDKGVGKIAPTPKPTHQGTYTATPYTPRKAPQQSNVRAALERASQRELTS